MVLHVIGTHLFPDRRVGIGTCEIRDDTDIFFYSSFCSISPGCFRLCGILCALTGFRLSRFGLPRFRLAVRRAARTAPQQCSGYRQSRHQCHSFSCFFHDSFSSIFMRLCAVFAIYIDLLSALFIWSFTGSPSLRSPQRFFRIPEPANGSGQARSEDNPRLPGFPAHFPQRTDRE